jgi:hypothetical protein
VGTAGLSGPGGADRVQWVRLALPAPVLPVGTVHLHDPDTGRSDVAGQAGAVAAGAFDPGQADGPEPAQPGQQAGIAARGGRELLQAAGLILSGIVVLAEPLGFYRHRKPS